MSTQSFLRSTTGKALQKLRDRHWLSRPCLPCLTTAAESALLDLVRECGENAEEDEKVEHLDFSLFRGEYVAPASSETVELEYTSAPAGNRDRPFTMEESKTLQEAAANRLQEFWNPLVPLGCVSYLLTLGGGYWSGVLCKCPDGPSAWGFAFPALAIVIQVYWLNRITILLSQTNVEGRPLLRLLRTLHCLDNYRVMAVLSIVDTFSRFTRAQFVGYLAHCHASVEKPFAEVFQDSCLYGVMAYVGIAGFAHLSFITGPIVIQFGYMFFLCFKIKEELAEAAEKTPGHDMDVTDSMDDLGALMQWAMLTPAGKVMDLAALPLRLEHEDDIERLWDRMLTQVWVTLARNIPDGIMQMNLQAMFFCLVNVNIDWSVRAQLLLNIVLASIGVIADSIELIFMNRRLTATAGLAMLAMLFFGIVRTIGAFVCEDSVTGVFGETFTCLQIDVGNWTSGIMPG